MSTPPSERPPGFPSNPFSTACVRPGALEYLFPPGQTAAQLVEALRQHGWWGQILGEHGSGKSTLLATLVPLIQNAGRQVELFTLHAGQKRLAASRDHRRGWIARTQVIVDGYEQLARTARWQLRRHCRAANAGLLVTAHRNVRLPLVARVRPSLPMIQQIVRRLMDAARGRPVVGTEGSAEGLIESDDVERCFAEHRGNVRETLFALYDLFERRVRQNGLRRKNEE